MSTSLDDAAFDEDPNAPDGYRSASAKTTCIAAVSVASVLFFFAQFVLPQFISMYFMPGLMGGGGMFQLEMPEVHKAALWQDRIWVPATRIGGPTPQTILKAATLDGKWDADSSLPISFVPDHLLADGDRLWCVSLGQVAFVEGGRVTTAYPKLRLNSPSNPFLQDGALHVIDCDPVGDWHVQAFRDGEWHRLGRLDLPRGVQPKPSNLPPNLANLQLGPQRLTVITNGPGFQALFTNGTAHWFAESLPMTSIEDAADGPVSALSAIAPDVWVQGDYIDDFSALLLGGRLAVVANTGGPMSKDLLAEWVQDGKRVLIDSLSLPLAEHHTVVAMSDDEAYVVADSFPPGEVRVIRLTAEGFESTERVKSGSLLAGQFAPFLQMYAFLFALPIVLLAMYVPTLHIAMRACRTMRYGFAHRTVRLASVGWRAIARGIDTLIYMAPVAAALLWLYLTFDLEQAIQQTTADPLSMAKSVGLFLLGFLTYGIVAIIVMGTLEGVCGWSPGKLLCGLRVVRTTLEPIGVLRGMIRQFLLVIDGQLNYLVGGVMVAVSVKQQRLGDLAADSIVIDADSLEEHETASVG
jgi:uncharacterized RDD family membrane protein YckC